MKLVSCLVTVTVVVSIIVGVTGMAGGATPQDRAEPVRYDPDTISSRVTVDGTSTVHDWEIQGSEILGSLLLPRGLPAVESDTFDLQVGAVEIPVESLKSGNGGMDRNTYKALKSDEHPSIRFEVTSVRPAAGGAEHGVLPIEAEGVLCIAGVERAMTIPMFIRQPSKNRLEVSGRTALKMTDFGIDPPTALLGTIRSGDDVTVSWTWALVRQTHPRAGMPDEHRRALSAAIHTYDEARWALAHGRRVQAQKALDKLQERIEHLLALPDGDLGADTAEAWKASLRSSVAAARKAAEAKRLREMRSAFEAVSMALASEISRFGHAERRPVYLYECSGPMGDSDRWLQLDQDVRCPYMTPRKQKGCDTQLVGVMAASASPE